MAKPFGGSGLPAALFHYSRDRGGTHPRGHPAGWSGILQADAYAGFNGLYAKGRAPAPLTEASCWAHGGAWFFELADLAKAMRAPMAIEAVRRIDGNRRRPWSSPDAYGWSHDFDHGTRMPAYRAVNNAVYEAVRHFLVRRHKVSSRGTRRFPDRVVFGELGVIRLRRVHLGPPPCALR